jgi:phosphohistidine phosphatase
MTELLLVRHAIACERDPLRWRNDALRPLSPRGERRLRRAAAGLRRLGIRPARVYTSTLARPRQTAAILASEARWPEATAIDALAPAQPVRQLMRMLAAQHVARIAVIGHEPYLGHLLAGCISADTDPPQVEFRKGGIACVAFRGAIRPGGGRLRWLLTPRMLRALAR